MPKKLPDIEKIFRQVEDEHIKKEKRTLWFYFLFFYLVLFFLYYIFLQNPGTRFYGVLIPLDFILTFIFAFYIMSKDLRVLSEYKCQILQIFHINTDDQNKVTLDHLVIPFVCILVASGLFFVFFVITSEPSQGFDKTHMGIKIFKFVISQVVMIGAIFVASKVYGMVLIGTLTGDFKKIMHQNMVNIVNKSY